MSCHNRKIANYLNCGKMNLEKSIFTIRKVSKALIKQQNNLRCNRLKSLLENKNIHIHSSIKSKYLASKPLTQPNNLQCITISQIGHQTLDFDGLDQAQAINKATPNIQITDIQHSPYFDGFQKEGIRMFHTFTNRVQTNISLSRFESTKPSAEKEVVLSRKDKLKRAVTEYGSTVIVFHVGISLVSLGTCYLLVSSGIDVGQILIPLGFTGSVASNAGTFVTAYAIHKVFAPVRISITLAATPFIVKYLRNIGFLKKPKPKVE